VTDADDRRTSREYALIERCFWLRIHLQADARRHLHHGFIQRLFMLQAGRINLLEDADPTDLAPRGVYLATELSLQANAYYLNLRGGLDNLAWCLQYYFSLIPGTSDSEGQRATVYLFAGPFLRALSAHLPSLANKIGALSDWATDLRNRRDPAAHRIPLQVPRTVFSEEDARRFRELEDQSAALIKAGQYDEGMELWRSTEKLGVFRALLVQSGTTGPAMVDLHEQIASDHDSFLTIGEAVIDELGRAISMPESAQAPLRAPSTDPR
jgi:hypothetical protein